VPELPDVEGYRRILSAQALGKRITAIEVDDQAVLRNTTTQAASLALVRRSFAAAERRGKWLIASLKRGDLVFHFGMTGRLEWLGRDDELGRFVRLRIRYSDGSLVYRDPRRLSGVWLCVGEGEVSTVTGPLGPDALDLSFSELDERLEARRGAVKTALMDQQVVAGLGNMLSDETLWRARVHPLHSYPDLTTARRKELHRALTSVLAASVRGGSIPRTRGWLSGQRGQADPRCPKAHGSLRISKIGGRTALWCPVCQPPSRASSLRQRSK
jgi:formamidopyrimidine-DNA glycosylase